jgi:hypothetical protein
MNKNLVGIFSILFLIVLISTSLASADLIIGSHTTDLTVFRNENVSGYFDLTNNGNESINNIYFGYVLPSGISITYNNTPTSLAANSTQRINFVLKASSSADLGDKSGTINAYGQNASNLSINLTTSFTFDLTIKTNYCESGNQGSKLRIDIDEPGDGDDYYAGENITVRLNVRTYDDIDFTIETELYDLTTDDIIDENSLDDSLDDEDDDYELELKIPYDIDSSDDYVVNIKVYEEDEEDTQCKQDSISIELKKRTHDLVIDKKSFNSIIACNSPLGLTLKIANSGKKDEDNTVVRVSNSALNFSAEQERDINSGDSETFYFNDLVPIVAPGKYTFDIRVSSDSVTDYDSFQIELKDNCVAQRKDVSLSILQQGTAAIGQDSIIKVTLTNTGNARMRYTISVSDYTSWGSLVKVEPTSLDVDAGQSADVFVTFKPSEQASSINTFKVKATYDTGSKTQDGTLSLQSNESTTQAASFFDQVSFEFKRNPGLFVVNIVLVIVVVILIVIAVRPRRKVVKEEKIETEPKEARLRRRKK